MKIAVLTPEKEIYSGDIVSVKVPGVNGQFEILNGHAPIVSSLGKGDVKIVKQDGAIMNFSIDKGFIEILDNVVSLLVRGVQEK